MYLNNFLSFTSIFLSHLDRYLRNNEVRVQYEYKLTVTSIEMLDRVLKIRVCAI